MPIGRIASFWLAALAAAPLPGLAACPADAAVAAYLEDFAAARTSPGLGKDLSLADAACARAKLVKELPRLLGPVAGYKAVFTHPDSQRRFGVNGPAWGVMFAHALHADGARMSSRFGALPRYEADFIVVVKDAGLADARDGREALDHIGALLPFIELPDIMLAGKPSGAELIAANAAFRAGIKGAPIEVTPANADDLLRGLAAMEVVITDHRGGEIGRERGSILMGNPINAAIWLARALRQDGIVLRPGDLLSLGGFLAAAPVAPATGITVRYSGLPGNPAVSVHFD